MLAFNRLWAWYSKTQHNKHIQTMSTVNLANYLSKVSELSLDNYDVRQNKIKLVLQLAQLDKCLTLPVEASTSNAESLCVNVF